MLEKTYKHTIITLDGEEQEITLNRMTMRHGLKLAGLHEGNAVEALIDLVAPGVLDIIDPESMNGLVEVIMEKEKGFFAKLNKGVGLQKTKRAKKSK